MNIYLDIDGVLLANENALAPHAEEFLSTILEKYPETTYWLTTHCWRGENRAAEILLPHLSPELSERIKLIKPTEWDEAKTDAIDFTKPFLWFDDDLYPDEKVALKKHSKLDSWVQVSLERFPNQLETLKANIK